MYTDIKLLFFFIIIMSLTSCSEKPIPYEKGDNLKFSDISGSREYINDLLFIKKKRAISNLRTVSSANEIKKIKESWIFDKEYEITEYYPCQKVMQRAYSFMKEIGIKNSPSVEMLYFSISNGRHVMTIEPENLNPKYGARFYGLGFDKEKNLAVYWVQFQPNKKETIIELVQVPKSVKHKLK